jgi:hypothetical protein
MNEAQRSERRIDRLVGRQLRERFKRGGADDILRTYLRLHERTGKIIGEHWLWCALERIAAGERETDVMADYDYARDTRTCTCHPDDNPPKPCARKYAYSECSKVPPNT